MVRIIPNRLKSSYTSTTNPNTISRSSSPNNMAARRDASPANASPLVLRIVVLRARNLAAKDRNNTSDPFLVLTLGSARDTTQYVPKTLNPEWNHMCELPVSTVDSLLLDCVCWDKDRFSKDYMGEFELLLDDIFADGKTEQAAKWYPLRSRRRGNKDSKVSGEVQLQFTLYDPTSPGSSAASVMEKLAHLTRLEITPSNSLKRGNSGNELATMGDLSAQTSRLSILDREEDSDDDDDEEDPSDEADDPSKPDYAAKKKRRMRIKGLKKRKTNRLYEFSGESDVVGIAFLEIWKVTDLPPEKNVTRTSFDMDPFVIASLGKKTYRTRVVRHSLDPVYNEKMIFQVLRHEQAYSLSFTVVDRDKLSGNDFICAAALPLSDITDTAPQADPETGLYKLKSPPGATSLPTKTSRPRLRFGALSRTSSSSSLSRNKIPTLQKSISNGTSSPQPSSSNPSLLLEPPAIQGLHTGDPLPAPTAVDDLDDRGDPELHDFPIPLKLKNAEKWEDKHKPELVIRAKYVPYPALRQQFWRAMLKQYDTDESGRISQIELTTMLDTLGSTLKESTIDGFFKRFPHLENEDGDFDLTIDQAVICLEDQLQIESKRKQSTMGDRVKHHLPGPPNVKKMFHSGDGSASESPEINRLSATAVEAQNVPAMGNAGEEGEYMNDELNDQQEEHVVEIKECPICHQPRLNRRSDSDIITHIATCASQDWRQVNNIVMAGFVTSSQAQRKWYSKVITKISYGGYKLGANSANILVQDRLTGQINEERMSIYVRLGIRLLYKGLKSRDMEKKRIRKLLKSLSIKQGIKYDDPDSKNEIAKFVAFHQLDMSEVLFPMEKFNSFNEFFYRQLKQGARPCSAPENPRIIVSPADSRAVVFNTMDAATKIWVKGREFNLTRLLGNAYPQDAQRYVGGALGIFRLAPQDYHRFHIPVDGVMGKPKLIEGEYYTVNPMAIRSALDVYGENVRVVVPIDSVAHGRVMVICVGAMMVGSTVITRKEGEKVARAEELGYFKFGGSTLLLLFEPGTMKFDDDLVDNSNGALETLVRVGMSIGHHPQQAQHAPDMRKKDADISEKERAEAKRRIEGSLAPEVGGQKHTAANMAG